MQAFNLAYAAAKGESGSYSELAEQLIAQMGEGNEAGFAGATPGQGSEGVRGSARSPITNNQ